MKLSLKIVAGLGLAVGAALPGAAMADAAIYAYPTANYCPAGLQPVTIAGVICCGTPTRQESYASMMQHPVKKRVHKVRRAAREYIPTQKGIPTGKGLGN